MGMFLSFLGGAAAGFSEEVEKSEKEAKAYAAMATKSLYDTKIENDKYNSELSKSMEADKNFILANKSNATPDQVNALLSNPEVMKKWRAYNNPADVDLDTLIKIVKTNPSVAVAAENVGAFEGIKDKAKETINTIQKTRGRTGLGGFIDTIGERAGGTAAAQTAAALGVSLESLQASKRIARPTSDATYNMSVFQEAPKSMEEIVKAAEVSRFQAKQKFGEDSEQYKAADAKYTAASTEIVKADKKLEDRLGLRLVALQDETDPTKKSVLQKEVSTLQAAVKSNREATSTNRERNGEPKEKTYSQTKMLMEDYLNTQMIQDRGLTWKKFMEPKTIKDPETGQTIVRLEKKVGLSPEAEQAVAEGMTKIRLQGLKDLGLVTESGAPRTPEVKNLITTYGLGATRPPAPPETVPGVTTTPAPTKPVTALPATTPKPVPAPVAAPAPVPAAQPAPKTQAEYDALPPGTEYTDTDGKVKRKGGK